MKQNSSLFAFKGKIKQWVLKIVLVRYVKTFHPFFKTISFLSSLFSCAYIHNANNNNSNNNNNNKLP